MRPRNPSFRRPKTAQATPAPPTFAVRGARRVRSPRLAPAIALIGALFLTGCQTDRSSTPELPVTQEQIALSFAPVVREAAPAVVSVYSRKRVAQQIDPLLADPFFRFFFEQFGRRPVPRQVTSLGSGVILERNGLIVTNFHVVDEADEIVVALADRREFPARIVGGDRAADLALLHIDTGEHALPTLPLGDSDQVQVGDLVLAIGNPFGIGQTVTSGIVSALARVTPSTGPERTFIQTDAAINPGNSGGALVTMDGRLIGINTAIFTRSGGSIGIGFAVPVDLVKRLVGRMEARGPIGHGLSRERLAIGATDA
jgi:S1-C subfamily serine protease